MACAPSEDSDQSGHLPSLIRVFAVCIKTAWVLSYPLSTQQRLWSDWADAKVDPSLRWVHMPFCWFCHEAAHIKTEQQHNESYKMKCANCKDSDQPVNLSLADWSEYPLSAWRITGTLATYRVPYKDCADVQASLGLYWVHMSFYKFCHALTQ